MIEDVNCAHLWPQLCGYSCVNGGYLRFRVDNDLEYELKVLECMGFIVTTENKEEIQMRVEGWMIDGEDEHAFCIDVENHAHQI